MIDPKAFAEITKNLVDRISIVERRESLGLAIDARQFGVVGDGSAIQRALNAAAATKTPVYVPRGVWSVATTLAIPAGVELFGAGPGATTLRATAAVNIINIVVADKVQVRDLTLD